MPFTRAAALAEVPPGKPKQVTLDGRTIALFNVHGTIYAIDDACPHRGAPLSQGPMVGTEVLCPWHMARFDVTTGKYLTPPARSDVTSYKVQIVGDEIQVDV
ncbi:MAG: non-heme iron oxygenase ferredoxin subunit [Gemmataceae bacterium]|nr:non-heme iron oxygenase ferredoxin subunit [Gemmataceae bacterium]